MKKIAIIPIISTKLDSLPNKELLMLGDKPLMMHTIDSVIETKKFNKILILTNSIECKAVLKNKKVEIIFDSNIKKLNTVKDIYIYIQNTNINYFNNDIFSILSPYYPFRNSKHVEESIEMFEQNLSKSDFLVSVQKNKSNNNYLGQIYQTKYPFSFDNISNEDSIANSAIFISKTKDFLNKSHLNALGYMMNDISSIEINNKLDFELAIAMLIKIKKNEILQKNIKNQIIEKERNFNIVKDLTLIGHSIMDRWELTKFQGFEVNNLGISGISTVEYQQLILDKNKIKDLGKYVFLMLGTNDIVDDRLTNQEIIDNINKFIENIHEINNQTQIYFLEMTSVAFRMDRSKYRIMDLNEKIKESMQKYVIYVDLNKYMTDEFFNLQLEYTVDGLHLSKEGYKQLENILIKEYNFA